MEMNLIVMHEAARGGVGDCGGGVVVGTFGRSTQDKHSDTSAEVIECHSLLAPPPPLLFFAPSSRSAAAHLVIAERPFSL